MTFVNKNKYSCTYGAIPSMQHRAALVLDAALPLGKPIWHCLWPSQHIAALY